MGAGTEMGDEGEKKVWASGQSGWYDSRCICPGDFRVRYLYTFVSGDTAIAMDIPQLFFWLDLYPDKL